MGPRDRLIVLGAAALADVELLAVLLSTGGAPGQDSLTAAASLLQRFPSLTHLRRAGIREICTVRGMGPARAARLAACLELGGRQLREPVPAGTLVSSAADLWPDFRERLRGLQRERFYVVLLDARHRKVGEALVGEGSLTSCPVEPREIFLPALRECAAAIVLVHNHPSGDPTPSSADHRFTARVGRAAAQLGIEVLDHIVIGRDRFFSFRDRGYPLGG